MLEITIPSAEYWDEVSETFVQHKGQTLKLEHSLVSLSKWESKYCKPFLSDNNKTTEETIEYIKFMTLTQNVDPEVYTRLSPEHINQVTDYINAKMTATTFSDTKKGKRNREIVTAEVIYYWMIALQIPIKCEKWHLNKLLTLIQVCNIKNQPAKKMSVRERLNRQAEINEANKKRFNTKG